MSLKPDDEFTVHLSVSISCPTGAAGSLHLNAHSEPVALPPDRMAQLVVKARSLMEELIAEYRD